MYFGYLLLIRNVQRFSHMLPLCFADVSCALEKLFNLMSSLWFIFAFVAFASGIKPETINTTADVEDLSVCVSF